MLAVYLDGGNESHKPSSRVDITRRGRCNREEGDLQGVGWVGVWWGAGGVDGKTWDGKKWDGKEWDGTCPSKPVGSSCSSWREMNGFEPAADPASDSTSAPGPAPASAWASSSSFRSRSSTSCRRGRGRPLRARSINQDRRSRRTSQTPGWGGVGWWGWYGDSGVVWLVRGGAVSG